MTRRESWARKCLLIPGVILALSGPPGGDLSARISSREGIQTLLLAGVEKGLNLDDRGAVADLTKVIEQAPDNPLGYAYLSMAFLFFYETGLDEKEKKKYETALLKAVEDAQARAGEKMEKDPRDGEACFSLAVARMVKNRYEILRKNYFRAFREAQGVWDLLERSRELDPKNFDVYYPMGVLHYHLAQLSGVARLFTSLFIAPGDKEVEDLIRQNVEKINCITEELVNLQQGEGILSECGDPEIVEEFFLSVLAKKSDYVHHQLEELMEDAAQCNEKINLPRVSLHFV